MNFIKLSCSMILGGIKIFVAYLDYLTAGKKNLLITNLNDANRIIKADKILIYAHWSNRMGFRDDELLLFDFFKRKGWFILVVSNTNNKVGCDDLERFNDNNLFVLRRGNRGRDLGAYRDAVRLLKQVDYNPSLLLFLNSSIVYLPSRFQSFYSRLIAQKSEFIPAVLSTQPFLHFQTFCFAFNSFDLGKIVNYFEVVRNTRIKQASVSFGELKLSRKFSFLPQQTSLYPYLELLKKATNQLRASTKSNEATSLARYRIIDALLSFHSGNSINPSHVFYRELYELGFLGVKAEILSKNPAKLRDIFFFVQDCPKQKDQRILLAWVKDGVRRPSSPMLRLRRQLRL